MQSMHNVSCCEVKVKTEKDKPMFGWASAQKKTAEMREWNLVNLNAIEEFQKVQMRTDMDREHLIESFLELAMCDPFSPEKTLVEAKSFVENICFE